MKRLFALVMCLTMLCGIGATPAAAAELPGEDQVVVNHNVEYLEDGSYFIETISKSAMQTYSQTVSGSKTATYYNASDVAIFSIKVSGTFTYDGSHAKATDASATLTAHVSGVTLESKDVYTSGASAIASATVKYLGIRLSKTVKLTCDKDGNLS